MQTTSWQDRDTKTNRPGPQQDVLDFSGDIPETPFSGYRIVENIDVEKLFGYLNEAALFRGRWGYRRGKMSKDEYEELHQQTILPLFRRLKEQSLSEGWLQPRVSYGYFDCASDGERLLVQSDQGEKVFSFPRQANAPGLCIADYFRPAEKGGDRVGFLLSPSVTGLPG